MPMVLPNASRPMKSTRVVKRAGAQRPIVFGDALDQDQHHAQHVLGDRFGVAAGLIDHQDAAFGAGLDVDRVVAGAIGRDEQEVRRLFQKFGAGVIVPCQLVPGRTGLISMGGR